MSDSSEEDQETYSGRVTKKELQAYIKIEYVRGNTVPIIAANLCEACSHDALNCSTVARWFNQFQEGRRSTENDAHTSRSSTTLVV